METLREMIKRHEGWRLKPLEDFSWFRTGMTSIKNNLFWIIIFAAFVVGLAAAGWSG